MFNVNYELAKALQQDHLRDAKHEQVNRSWNMRRKALKKVRGRERKS